MVEFCRQQGAVWRAMLLAEGVVHFFVGCVFRPLRQLAVSMDPFGVDLPLYLT